MRHKTLFVIAGPTASGKSQLAMKLADEYSSDIFSADSRQIYKELTIGTAKPSKEDLNAVQHHFIDHISVADDYSGGKFSREFRDSLASYFQHRQNAILVGGTGLYIQLALEGMDMIPEVPIEITTRFESLYQTEGLEALQEELYKLDPEYCHVVDMQNSRRLIRALSVSTASGHPFSSFRKQNKSALPYRILPFLLDLPREELYTRIDSRVDRMVEQGLKDEALALLHLRGLKALDTVGYREWYDYADQNVDEATAILMIKQNSRRYAKRQITWFKKYGEWHILHGLNWDDKLANIRGAYENE